MMTVEKISYIPKCKRFLTPGIIHSRITFILMGPEKNRIIARVLLTHLLFHDFVNNCLIILLFVYND